MKIDKFRIGEGKAFLVAEIGKNHNGDIDIAKYLVKLAFYAGFDAVKFQAYNVETLLHTTFSSDVEPEIEWLKKCELSEGDFKGLKSLCDSLGIIFLATPESIGWVDVLHRLKVSAFKVSSLNIDNFHMLKHIDSFWKPVILSTGMSSLGEVQRATSYLTNCDYALLHCVSQYPASFESVNLNAIRKMKEYFQCPIGFSDHTQGAIASIGASFVGADIIEVHITHNCKAEGPDHAFSLSADMLSPFVSTVRFSEIMLGSGIKEPHIDELKGGYKEQKRRCCVANTDISKGEAISQDTITCLCPGDVETVSAAEYYELTNGTYLALRDIKKGMPIFRQWVGRRAQ